MSGKLKNELSTLVEKEVISPEVANKIADYYEIQNSKSSNRVITIFGVFGALLISLGIILIIAHNWDNISNATKTILAFVPLTIGQIACIYAHQKKQNNITWKEGSSGFLFFAVAATISLISQIYHIPGSFSVFLLSWMLLTLPLVYIMGVSLVGLFYIIGITVYASEQGYWIATTTVSYNYWLLLLLIIPKYLSYLRNKNFSNFFHFYSWLIPLSMTIILGAFTTTYGEIMFVTYALLMAVFYQIGKSDYFREQSLMANPFALIGSLGTIVILLMLSFKWYWEDVSGQSWEVGALIGSFEFISGIILAVVAIVLILKHHPHLMLKQLYLLEVAGFLLVFLLVIGLINTYAAIVLVNLLVLLIGVNTIAKGANADSLVILNYGLLMIAAIAACRFFDAQISFIMRGILFVLVGIGFFAGNYRFLKKRNKPVEN